MTTLAIGWFNDLLGNIGWMIVSFAAGAVIGPWVLAKIANATGAKK